MPLTSFQTEIALALAKNRTEDSHLAGGAALHIAKDSIRYSNDLDYFNDTDARVAQAFAADRQTLEALGHRVEVELSQPGYIRVIVSDGKQRTKIEWAMDSAWRFMPAQKDSVCGYRLHPVDLAINKVLALVGRDEPRDFLDVVDSDRKILPLGAMCWAAAGKDPGYTPHQLLELLKRRGKVRPEDFKRLKLAVAVDPVKLKEQWRSMLEAAEKFINERPEKEVGCLYFSKKNDRFIAPSVGPLDSDVTPHFGKPAGVLPVVGEE